VRSPASGVRRQLPHATVLGGSAPMLLRTRIEASSGMKMGSRRVGKALHPEKSPLLPSFLLG
jgi:hypothetical protein